MKEGQEAFGISVNKEGEAGRDSGSATDVEDVDDVQSADSDQERYDRTQAREKDAC